MRSRGEGVNSATAYNYGRCGHLLGSTSPGIDQTVVARAQAPHFYRGSLGLPGARWSSPRRKLCSATGSGVEVARNLHVAPGDAGSCAQSQFPAAEPSHQTEETAHQTEETSHRAERPPAGLQRHHPPRTAHQPPHDVLGVVPVEPQSPVDRDQAPGCTGIILLNRAKHPSSRTVSPSAAVGDTDPSSGTPVMMLEPARWRATP